MARSPLSCPRFVPLALTVLPTEIKAQRVPLFADGSVRTEDIGNKLTDHIGYTSDWADALEKCVTDTTGGADRGRPSSPRYLTKKCG